MSQRREVDECTERSYSLCVVFLMEDLESDLYDFSPRKTAVSQRAFFHDLSSSSQL